MRDQLEGSNTFVLRVRGDGRGYQFTVQTGAGFNAPTYQLAFMPRRGEWGEYHLAFDDFVPTFRGRRLANLPPLTAEKIVLPNGHAMEIEIIRHPGASAIVPLTAEGDVILIRQYRHAAGGFIYEVPAGKLDKGEAPELCAGRELTEEAGVIAGHLTKMASIITAPGFTDEVIHLFLATDLKPAATAHEPSEVITLLRRPLAECLEMIVRGEIIDGKSICALFLAHKLVTEQGRGPSGVPRSS